MNYILCLFTLFTISLCSSETGDAKNQENKRTRTYTHSLCNNRNAQSEKRIKENKKNVQIICCCRLYIRIKWNIHSSNAYCPNNTPHTRAVTIQTFKSEKKKCSVAQKPPPFTHSLTYSHTNIRTDSIYFRLFVRVAYFVLKIFSSTFNKE